MKVQGGTEVAAKPQEPPSLPKRKRWRRQGDNECIVPTEPPRIKKLKKRAKTRQPLAQRSCEGPAIGARASGAVPVAPDVADLDAEAGEPAPDEAATAARQPQRQQISTKKRKRQKCAGDAHSVFVKKVLPIQKAEDATDLHWRLEKLVEEGHEGLKVAEAPGGVEVTVGPFALRPARHKRAALWTALAGADTAVSALLGCFACLATPHGQEPLVTFDESDAVAALLRRELAALLEARAADGAGAGAAPLEQKRQALRDALASLQGMIDASQPLSDEHRAVYVSAGPVLSETECGEVVAAAEAFAAANGGWTTDRHVAYPTHDLPVAALGRVGARARTLVKDRLLPELAARFGLDAAGLSFQDMFVAKYCAEKGGLAALAEHEDDSQWSFVLALNDGATEYGGGGTQFVALEGKPVHRPGRGHATMFSGKNRHCGVATTSGTRYVLAGFLNYQGSDGREVAWIAPRRL